MKLFGGSGVIFVRNKLEPSTLYEYLAEKDAMGAGINGNHGVTRRGTANGVHGGRRAPLVAGFELCRKAGPESHGGDGCHTGEGRGALRRDGIGRAAQAAHRAVGGAGERRRMGAHLPGSHRVEAHPQPGGPGAGQTPLLPALRGLPRLWRLLRRVRQPAGGAVRGG